MLASLRRQSLVATEFEVIFVDDGSTDGTRERLEALAGEVPNFRVIAISPSGWPGKPRNVGIDAARGEYIQFVDNDDELGNEALERLWNYASTNRSDVVIGREERRNRRMFVGAMFRENRPRAILGKDPTARIAHAPQDVPPRLPGRSAISAFWKGHDGWRTISLSSRLTSVRT